VNGVVDSACNKVALA